MTEVRFDQKILAIDTSAGVCSVACGVSGVIVSERSVATQSSHFEILDSLVGEVLQAAGWGLSDLEGIVLGAGPGSFTGLRIGFGYAKGLCAGLQLPVAAASSFAAAAYASTEAKCRTAVVGVARRDFFFLGIFDVDTEAVPVIEDLPVERLRAGVPKDIGQIVAVGPPPPAIQNVFLGCIGETRVASGLLGIVWRSPQRWYCGAEEIAQLEPAYGQKVAAKTIAERSLRSGS